MNLERIKKAFFKTIFGFKQMMPMIIGVITLVSLSVALIPDWFYKIIFTDNKILDPLVASGLGSISAGNPIMSYVIGGELLAQGVGVIAITAFMLTWVTVGVVQLPAESIMLGKKFAITRNIISFVMAIIASFLITFTVSFV